MVFLKVIRSFVSRFRNYISLKFFRKFSLVLKREEKHCNSEIFEDYRNVQRQIFRKIVQVSLKPFSSKKINR